MIYEIKLDPPLIETDGNYCLDLGEDEMQILVFVIKNYYTQKNIDDSPQIDKMLGIFRKIEKLMLERSFSDRVAESSERLNDETFQRQFIYKS